MRRAFLGFGIAVLAFVGFLLVFDGTGMLAKQILPMGNASGVAIMAYVFDRESTLGSNRNLAVVTSLYTELCPNHSPDACQSSLAGDALSPERPLDLFLPVPEFVHVGLDLVDAVDHVFLWQLGLQILDALAEGRDGFVQVFDGRAVVVQLRLDSLEFVRELVELLLEVAD
jgi:hypothetical protein